MEGISYCKIKSDREREKGRETEGRDREINRGETER
jgi:hypothetical protein